MTMMELLKILLSINLIFISTSATDNIESDKHQLSIKPIAYNVTLILFKDEVDYQQEYIRETLFRRRPVHRTFIKFISKRRKENEFVFYGESILLFQDINKKRVLRLHARNLVINTVATKIRYFANGMNNEIAPKEHIVHKKQQTIDIIFDYPFLQGIDTYRVIVKFLGSIPDNTGGITGKNDKDFNNKKTWLFAADLQGAGARQLFPCWDEPNIRTNFTISVKHDQYYSVLSNTEAIDNFKVRLGKNWSRFETTVKISPYHIMIILHKFKRLNDSNVWCRKNVEQQVKWIHTIAKIATLHLKLKYDDIIYPLTVTHVIIPGFQDTGMSSWGIVLHRETDVLYDKKLDFIAKKFEMAFMIARKMAHQYIGNLLAQSSWSYLWLNEGIATFLAMKIVKQHEHPQLMDLFVVKFQHESLRLNDYYNMSLIDEVDTSSDIASLFPLTYYVRAPIFIRSLDKALPEEILDISINDYISKYKFKSVNTSTSTLEYFLNVIQNNIITEVPEEYKEYTNIIEIFTQWAKQERYPVLQVSQRMSSPNEVKVYIAEPYPKKWSIYVTYITQKNPNIGHKVWLKEPHTDLYLPVNNSDWIIINVEQAGYYRVNYNNNNWEKLGNYLNSREYTNIHVLNRAQIIDDAYYFMSTNNKLNFNIFKALTYYLSKETNYIAWYPMFKILEQISGFFPFLQSSEVKEHFRKILDNVLEKIGYTDIMEENNFTKCLRLEAAKWACTLGSQKCTTTASSELIQLYKKPNLIWPEWKKWTYCKGMMVAHNITWKEMLTEYTLDFDNKRLEYLACSENSDNIIFYIKQLKSIYFTKLQYPITIFHSIIARHAKNNLILNYILDNLTSIIPSKVKMIVALTNIINYIYSTEQIDKVKDKLLKKVNSTLVHSYIEKKIKLRSLQIENHIGYFQKVLKI